MHLSSLIVVTFVVSLIGGVEANALRSAMPSTVNERVRIEDVEATLLSELAGAVGHGTGEAKVSRLSEDLRTMYEALPKNEAGGLGQAAVRYALHRFFVKKHGWFVKGLDPAGAARNASFGVEMLKARVPAYIEGLFEERLGGRGFGLQELAILAATLEHLVHDEAIQRLQSAYQAYGLPTTDRISEEELSEVIDAYMVVYILGGDLATMAPHEVHAIQNDIVQMYPGWSDTQVWLRDVRGSVAYNDRGQTNPFTGGEIDFLHTAHMVEEIGEQYGRFQDLECRNLKRGLMEREGDVPGRVPLSNFFKKGLDGNFLFTESVQYLRHSGALDETDPKRPSVIMPNYLTSPSNCLSTSSFYSVCCLDECESLMEHLERKIGTSTATAADISALVSGLPSDTVDAPRALSAPLLRRLDEIADNHGGRIPLHGRLFAQWMHHAYPRECPYPHVGGTSVSHHELSSENASEEEMSLYTRTAVPDSQFNSEDAKLEALPWTTDEELLDNMGYLSQGPARCSVTAIFGNLLLVVAVLSVLYSLVRDSKEAVLPMHNAKFGKYSV